MNQNIRYAIGVDLALVSDFTAVTVLQRTKPEPAMKTPLWTAIHIERLPLGTPHPEINDHIVEILMALPGVTHLRRRDRRQPFALAFDATGVGRPIFHELSKMVPTAVGVVITGGREVNGSDSMPTVPKADLVATAQIALEHHRLTIDRDLPYADLLAHELLAFEARPTPAGNMTFSARQDEHDDLVLSLCLALWLGNRTATNCRVQGRAPRGQAPEIGPGFFAA